MRPAGRRGHMVDLVQSGRFAARLAAGMKIVFPETRPAVSRLHQIDQCPVGRAHRRDLSLAVADPAPAIQGRARRAPGQPRARDRPPGSPWRTPTLRAAGKCSAPALSCSAFSTRLMRPGDTDRPTSTGDGRRAGSPAAAESPASSSLAACRPRQTPGTPCHRHRALPAGRRRVASASARIRDRSPSRATRRAGAARKSSLNTSSESGPRIAGGEHRAHGTRSRRDRPGRGNCGNAGSNSARPWTASARRPSARRTAFRGGTVRSRTDRHPGSRCGTSRRSARAPDGRLAARCARHAPKVDVAAPGQGLVADAQAAAGGALGHLGQVRRGAESSSMAAGWVLLHTSVRSVPSACMTSNFRSARSMLRARCGSGIASKSRNGW